MQRDMRRAHHALEDDVDRRGVAHAVADAARVEQRAAFEVDLELAVQDSSFDGLQSGLSLNSNQCDIVASAMTITEDREENIDFTEPYYDSKQSLLVPNDSDIESIDDLAGKKVGVQQGTTGKTYTEENAPDAQIISFPSDGEMYPAIQAGQVDALLQDLPVNINHTEDGEFKIVEEFETDESYGFAVREEGRIDGKLIAEIQARQAQPQPAVNRRDKSELGRCLADGTFAVVVEMAAPRGLHLESAVAQARRF